MIQCPECRQMIPDDSAYCDQCGKVLMWCPTCKRPKRGTECPLCGSDLVPGPKYMSGNYEASAINKADATGDTSPRSSGAPAPSVNQPATRLVGAGMALVLREGPFGRRGGIWPELGTCQYVSGSHGAVGRSGNDWTITDSGSTNGTFVNGKRLSTGVATPLKRGDRVKIATLEFTVE